MAHLRTSLLLLTLAACSPWPASPPAPPAVEAGTTWRLLDRDGEPKGTWKTAASPEGVRTETLRAETPAGTVRLDGVWTPGAAPGLGRWEARVQVGSRVERTRLSLDGSEATLDRREGLAVRRTTSPTPVDRVLWSQMVIPMDGGPGSVLAWERLAEVLPRFDAPGTLAALDPRRGLPVTLRVEPLSTRPGTLDGAPVQATRTFVASRATGRTFWLDEDGRLLQVSPGPFGLTLARPGFEAGPVPTRPRPSGLSAQARTLDRADVTLAGTLTVPSQAPPRPTVLLLHGSGPADRDESPHMVFRDLAWGLGRRGYPVLRYDKRGVGESVLAEDAGPTTLDDLVGDAAAWARAMAADPEGAGCVVALGHSEGGYIAPLVARDVAGVAGVVLFAGPVQDLFTVAQEQGRLIVAAHGATEDELASVAARQDLLFRRLRSDAEPVTAGPGADMEAWLKSHAHHDPAAPLRALQVPLLALFADGDLQVPVASQSARLRALVGDRPDVTIEVLPGLDHLFMDDRDGFGGTGLLTHPDRRLSPAAVARVADWLDGIACPDPRDEGAPVPGP